MIVQFNTDKNIAGGERHRAYFNSMIETELQRYSDHITRVEMHVSSEKGEKEGLQDIKCLLEVRLKGRSPLVITNHSTREELAISGATDKLRNSLESILGKLSEH